MTNNQSEIQLRTIDNTQYLKHIRYSTNSSSKFLKPDLIFEDIFIVRFRPFLVDFFIALMTEEIEIVLWTAALRSLYTPLMCIVHQMLMNRIQSVSQTLEQPEQQLWSYILYRDNCTQRSNGTYFKNLSQIGRDLNSIAMVDNLWQNFSGFETNGLPIIDFYGHSSDDQLLILTNVFTQILTVDDDIRLYLHSYAKYYGFNVSGISQMMNFVHNENVLEFDEDMDDIELEIELENLNIADELSSMKTDDLHTLQMQSLEDVHHAEQHTSTDDESVSDFESDFADDDNYDRNQLLTNAYATFDDMNDSTPNISAHKD